MKKLTKIYHVYDEGGEGEEGEDAHYGEIEGMFTADGELLDAWCLNDAHWRSEYMNGFMQALGFNVVSTDDKKLLKKLREHFA